MTRTTLAAAVLLLALSLPALSQSGANPAGEGTENPPTPSALDADLFYKLLLGEISARSDDPAEGVALMLEAARKTNDPELYQRAVELAFEARSGEAALQAARAWKQAFPKSREANRFVLQILVALNRIGETAEPLRTDLALAADAKERNAVLSILPRVYARASDKKLAAATAEQAVSAYLSQPETGPNAWASIGRLRLAAGDTAGALEAARRAQALDVRSDVAALLALELMDPKVPQAEPMVRKYIDGKPLPELRMAYARALLDAQRYAEAAAQIQVVTAEKPDFPEAWLVQGTLLLQDNRDAQAEASLKRYVELVQSQRSGEEKSRGLAQAYMSLSRIAEKRKDFALANAWLDKIENPQDLVAAQNRRASILAKQGKMAEARALLHALPERNADDKRMKLSAEVQLLRDNKQYKAAYDLLAAATREEFDADLVYDQAMLAEKLGNLADMEKLLRQVMEKKPEYHAAYNALGYSFADRNVRLPEAKTLIQKALSFAPDDPFISDSLAWVEFRMGNKQEALRILNVAYKARPDSDIAAHLGEVLWSLGERDRAQAIWKEGLLLNGDNETLQETLKRLRVKP